MGEPAEIQAYRSAPLEPRRAAVRALPRRQASWVAVQTVTLSGLVLAGLWTTEPSLALSLSLGTGVWATNPRKWWSLPLVLAAVVLGGLGFDFLKWPAVLGAGAMAGLAAAWLMPHPTDVLDYAHGALATAAGASLGLWAAVSLLPAGTTLGAIVTGVIVSLVASQGLVPLAIRFDHPTLPSRRKVRKELLPPYREPVFKAFDIYESMKAKAPDAGTRRGLCEVATWVFRLQKTLMTLDQDLETIDPVATKERIRSYESQSAEDEFTRERRLATAKHLKRLLDHRDLITVEHGRTEALVDYALAFLEEARAGLTIAQTLPGEASPDRLGEVLGRLRSHAQEGDARRRTAREMGQLEV